MASSRQWRVQHAPAVLNNGNIGQSTIQSANLLLNMISLSDLRPRFSLQQAVRSVPGTARDNAYRGSCEAGRKRKIWKAMLSEAFKSPLFTSELSNTSNAMWDCLRTRLGGLLRFGFRISLVNAPHSGPYLPIIFSLNIFLVCFKAKSHASPDDLRLPTFELGVKEL